ncbi:GRAM domain-containing [Brachionus plicatilis]|uniref:GRAM domain-containing n=1 Tax=Brachionus plicatilis TaxID=10195 RepID=A0A3M7PG02_BRAPC|nr:GRAM domain-containing [Brachionus plicatilis]
MSIKSSTRNHLNRKYKSTVHNGGKLSSNQTEQIPECNCIDHNGKIYLDQVFEMSFSYLFECLFEFNEFYYEFLKTRKISEFKVDDWKIENEIKIRRAEYLIEISHAIASKYCKNVETYKIVKYVENSICVIETETFSSGVIYSDCFKICHRYCLTGSPSDNRCRLKVHSSLIYLSKPNFVIKALIDKNCYASLSDFFKGMLESLQYECERLRMFNLSIIKTSTEIDFKKSTIETKSSLTSSMTSSKNFSSDDEISSSDEAITSKKSSFSKIVKTSGSNGIICSNLEPKENEILLPNKRSLSQRHYEKDKNSDSLEFSEKNDNQRKYDSLNFKIDLFIKFFLAL